MNFEYSDKITFQDPKLRLVTDKEGRLFVRKNVRVDSELVARLQKISCPYIVNLAEFGEDEDGAYVIEEYVEGVTAAESLLTRKQAVKVLMQLCDALEALHREKIIHRDIKPSNIIITKDGRIKLIDFDASRIEKTVKDKDTQILGTEGFAPPEQFGFSQTDCRSDIYSFGVTMNMLLGENSAPFMKVIKKCKALDPNNRYDNISQVKTAIRLASLKRFSAIPAAALLLIVFTAALSIVLNRRTSDAYITGSGFISSELSDIYSHSQNSGISQSSQPPSSVSPQRSDLSQGSKPPQSSSLSQSLSSPQSSPQSSSTTQSSSLPQSSSSLQSSSTTQSSSMSQSSGMPQSSSSLQSSSLPQSSEPPQDTEKIFSPDGFYYTYINSYGYYADVCNYRFVDDNSIYGLWKSIGTIDRDHLGGLYAGDTDIIIPNDNIIPWLQNITFSADGAAVINDDWEIKWTKGYMLIDSRFTISKMLTVAVNGKEYLLIENKNGDYSIHGFVDSFFVLQRPEDINVQGEPDNSSAAEDPDGNSAPENGKITYTTSINSNGSYEDSCDYRFYDDPAVHGSWIITGIIKAKKYDDWIEGKTDFTGLNDAWLREIVISDDNIAIVNKTKEWEWTNGYLVRDTKVSALYTVNVGGAEYLVIENKNGDYSRTGKVGSYLIYTRADN